MKHFEKFLFVVCLAFYAWGFIDKRFQQWSMIGGFSTFIAYVAYRRKLKGETIVDLSLIVMLSGVMILVALQFAHLLRR